MVIIYITISLSKIMEYKEKIKYINKLKHYVLKYIGQDYNPYEQDWSDYDTLCMFGNVYIHEENDLFNIMYIVKLFEDNEIELAVGYFHKFLHPEPETMIGFYKKNIQHIISGF